MSVGTPVVTTEVPAITEVCGDGVSAVPVGDAEAVAEAVDALLGDDELRRVQTERGHEVVARYDWDRTVDALCDHMLAWPTRPDRLDGGPARGRARPPHATRIPRCARS